MALLAVDWLAVYVVVRDAVDGSGFGKVDSVVGWFASASIVSRH